MAMLRRSVDLEAGPCDPRRHEVGIRVPCKKMKKRRELDALVAKSHKSLSAVYKSGGGGGFPGPHGPLLKNDSDSGSDLEGFPSVVSPKHQSACCKSSGGRSGGGLWVPAWLFLIVLIGTLVSATLLWLHIGLKQDFTLLRSHLAKVDAEGKRVPDSFREVDQRLNQLLANQSQVAKQLEQLSLRLDQISRDVGLVNGSAQQIRGTVTEAVNNQLPGHLSQLNGSVHDLQSKITNLSGELATVRMELTSVEGRAQHRLDEAVNKFNDSTVAIEDVISGSDTTSTLGREFNATLARAISRAQNESSSKFEERISNTLKEMKRASAPTPTPSSTPPRQQQQPQHPQVSTGVDEDQHQVQHRTEANTAQTETGNAANVDKASNPTQPATTTSAPPSQTKQTNQIVIVDYDKKSSGVNEKSTPEAGAVVRPA